MLKAGSIIYALVIALLIALLCSGLIAADQLYRVEQQQHLQQAKSLQYFQSGLNALRQIPEVEFQRELSLFGGVGDSVQLKKLPWGLFEVHAVKTLNQHAVHGKAALMGGLPSDQPEEALYLTDRGRPLKVAGSTLLKGKCALPASGIERAYIEGTSFTGDELVTGKVVESGRTLPPYQVPLVEALRERLKNGWQDGDTAIVWENYWGNELKRSFLQNTVVIQSAGPIELNEFTAEGNVIFWSKHSIKVGQNAALQGVLLLAPSIYIDDFTAGTFQAFATDSIYTGDDVTLHYPSILGVVENAKDNRKLTVDIGERTTIQGLVFAIDAKPNPRFPVQLSVGRETLVEGLIYAEGELQLKGKVAGSVYASELTLKTPSSIYQNHLLNAKIDLTARSQFQCPSSFLAEAPSTQIVQWLN